MAARSSLIRWRALGPLAGFLLILGLIWLLIADRVARVSLEEFGTQFLGTQVDVEWLRINELQAGVELRGLAIADPFDVSRNIIEVGRVEISLDPEPLLEKKVVIRELVLDEVSLATVRSTPATPVPGGGILSRTATTLAPWRARLAQPLLGFSSVDSIREMVLNPDELISVQAARSLAAQADSARLTFLEGVAGLDLKGLVEDGEALTARVSEADPARLGIGGMRQLLSDAGAYTERLDDIEEQLAGVEQHARSTIDVLDDGIARLDEARAEDYQRVGQAVGLPGLVGPAIGGRLFGDVSLSFIERGLYWAELVRRYMPSGLESRLTPGPRRARAAGSTVRFPKRGHAPTFLLEAGRVSDAGSATQGDRRHALRLANLTSTPALVGSPAEIRFERTAGGAVDLGLDAIIDHTREVPRDSLTVVSRNSLLPSIVIPGLPLTADLGVGMNRLQAVIEGDRFVASWILEAPAVRWSHGEADQPIPLEQRLLMDVLTGLGELRITAAVEGTTNGLEVFNIRSNVDDALASHIESLAGDAVRLAQQRARAEVDRLSGAAVDTVIARTGLARTVVGQTATDWDEALGEVRRQLEEQIRARTGGLGGVIGMLMPIDGSPSYSK